MRPEEVGPLLERVTEDLPEPETDLADTAWSRGTELRRRHRRSTALTAALTASVVLAVVIGLSLGGGKTGLVPPDRPPDRPPGYVPPSGQIAGMDFWLAPPSGSERFLDRLETPLGDVLRLPEAPTELALEPIDRIAAVVLARRSGGYEPLLLGPDALWARSDVLLAPIATGAPLSTGTISPDGTLVAFPQPGHVAVIDATTAHVRRYSVPEQDLRTVAWLPDGERLLTGGPAGTYRVLVGQGSDGEATVMPIEPTDDPASATAPYRLDGPDGQVTLRYYGGTGWTIYGVPHLPVDTWIGQTFATEEVAARLFVANPLPQVRTVASRPQVLAAISTVERLPSRLLVLAETPAATPPPSPTPAPPDAVRTPGCCFVLGWYDDSTVLFQVTGWVLAWDLRVGQVRRVTELEVPAVAIGPGIRD